MRATRTCAPVAMLVSFPPSIITSVPIVQLPASNSSEEAMCQQEPSARVAIPPLFIATSVVFLDAIASPYFHPLRASPVAERGRVTAPCKDCKSRVRGTDTNKASPQSRLRLW